MPNYDFRCRYCGTVKTIKRTIKNRNRGPSTCTEVRGLGEDPCGGKYIRVFTPLAFRFNR